MRISADLCGNSRTHDACVNTLFSQHGRTHYEHMAQFLARMVSCGVARGAAAAESAGVNEVVEDILAHEFDEPSRPCRAFLLNAARVLYVYMIYNMYACRQYH